MWSYTFGNMLFWTFWFLIRDFIFNDGKVTGKRDCESVFVFQETWSTEVSRHGRWWEDRKNWEVSLFCSRRQREFYVLYNLLTFGFMNMVGHTNQNIWKRVTIVTHMKWREVSLGIVPWNSFNSLHTCVSKNEACESEVHSAESILWWYYIFSVWKIEKVKLFRWLMCYKASLMGNSVFIY